MQFPYIIEGEIIEVQKRGLLEKDSVRYLVKAINPDGGFIILPNVEEMSMFGGIADYFQRRARSSKDTESVPGPKKIQSALDSTVGDRVYISFINGDFRKPIIIGYAQHPSQVSEFNKLYPPESADPQAALSYNGVRVFVDGTGQLKIIHNGAPTIKDLGGIPAPNLPDPLSLVGSINPAVIPAPQTEVTILEILDGGIFRVRDSDGQIIEINRDKKRILLSNNNYSSLFPAFVDLPDVAASLISDYVKIDDSEQAVTISSRKVTNIISQTDRKDQTLGNQTNTVIGNVDAKIGGDKASIIAGNWGLTAGGNVEVTAAGNQASTIGGDVTSKIAGKSSSVVAGEWEVTSVGGISLNGGGAQIKLAKGQVAIGNPAAELLDLMDQFLTQVQSLTVGTGVGPSSPPINIAAFAAIQVKLNLIKGSL